MWTGIIRRFSSDETSPLEPSSSSSLESRGAEEALRRNDDGRADVVFAPRQPSPFRPPPLDPVVLHGYKDSTPVGARLLTGAMAEEIRTMVPERLRIAEDWNLIYSLEQNGASLATLYQRCRTYAGMRVGFVLVVKDQEGGIFGAYLSEYPHPAPSYFGNGECFLWRVSTLTALPLSDATAPLMASSPPNLRFKAFPYSGLNDFYMNCETGYLSVGSGGGHYGLWLDDSLDVGHSSTCETFGNEPLSEAGHKFRVLAVELWVIGAS